MSSPDDPSTLQIKPWKTSKKEISFSLKHFFCQLQTFFFQTIWMLFFHRNKLLNFEKCGQHNFLWKMAFFDHIFLVKRFGIKVVCRVRRPSKRPKVVLTCRKQPSGSIKIIAKKSFVCLRASKLASKDISCLVLFYVTTCDQLIKPLLRTCLHMG